MTYTDEIFPSDRGSSHVRASLLRSRAALLDDSKQAPAAGLVSAHLPRMDHGSSARISNLMSPAPESPIPRAPPRENHLHLTRALERAFLTITRQDVLNLVSEGATPGIGGSLSPGKPPELRPAVHPFGPKLCPGFPTKTGIIRACVGLGLVLPSCR